VFKFYYSIPIVTNMIALYWIVSRIHHKVCYRKGDADYTRPKHIMWYRPCKELSPPDQLRSSRATISKSALKGS